MAVYQDLNEAALRALALTPEWVDVSDYTGAPDSASDGVPLNKTPKALVYVAAREDAHRRTGRVKVTTFDLSATTYTVVIGGNTVTYNAATESPADNAALISGIAAKIEADASAGALVSATTDPDDASTVLIQGLAEADYSLDASVSGGSGAVEVTADATGFGVTLWVTPAGTVKSGSTGSVNRWVRPRNGSFSGLVYGGWVERFDVGGFDRLYPEIKNVTKHASDGASLTAQIARVMVGPAVLSS